MTKKWSLQETKKIYNLPFFALIYKAQSIHKRYFDPNEIQISTLLSIKTGSCPEDCSYCPQSAHYKTNIQKTPLMKIEEVITATQKAKAAGSTRFCMGAAWRGPRDKDLELVREMIKEVKKLGLETCVTLGLLKNRQIKMLEEIGLDFYNHNIDSSPEFYNQIVTTRSFEDRLQTLEAVSKTKIKLCCGGILGMGEANDDRIKMITLLSNLDKTPDSIPINKLIKIPGTPLENQNDIDSFDLIRIIALVRILMPKAYIRLSAGREQMIDEVQALCFFSGANSIFYGEKLLTADNPIPEKDNQLFQKLGLTKQILS